MANDAARDYVRTIKERYQLVASALRAQSKGDGRESTDGVQAEEDIVMLCCVSSRPNDMRALL